MKNFILPLFTTLFLSTSAHAKPLAEPDLNQCNGADGITKCEVRCARSLGEQCLIMHINFEGQNLKSETDLIRAKFLTCKNANLDLQIKSLSVELEKLDERQTQAKITSTVSASGKTTSLKQHDKISFDATRIDDRLARTYFKEFINSGDKFVEAEIKLAQCGHEDNSNSCKISGTLVAVTDPNIRCDFHDTTKAGAYITVKPKGQIGRVGQ